MGKLSFEDLKGLRDRQRVELSGDKCGKCGNNIKITVGMGTCGIAAGARQTFDTFVDEIGKAGVGHAVVRQTGCIGQCHSEPTVEVRVAGMPVVVYGKVDAETAKKIVRRHVVEKALVQDHIYDCPAADIIN
jgi:NADP-reducing hydrogenase subunit HndB